MNFFLKFFITLFIFFFIVNAQSEEKLYYLDVDKILNNSKAGISIKNQLDQLYIENSNKLKKQQDVLKKRELSLKTQKNLLKNDEFNKILQQLKVDINNFNKANKEKLNLIEKIKLNATNKLMNEVKIILIEFSDKESISIVVEKKSIIIGKTELDLTDDVLVIIDKKIQSIKLDK
tara:strand:+ start:801 stop:1328 length:528 start_codon:yes stop_codon:yes gene_type:complete